MKTTGAIKLFLRMALATAFLSAVADRFGFWGATAVWGNWENFLAYTQLINPWLPASFIPPVGVVVTVVEMVFALALLVGYRTALFARLSGGLLLAFALAMTFSVGIKAALDYSVFSASAAAFALSLVKDRLLELDALLASK